MNTSKLIVHFLRQRFPNISRTRTKWFDWDSPGGSPDQARVSRTYLKCPQPVPGDAAPLAESHEVFKRGRDVTGLCDFLDPLVRVNRDA